MDLFMGYTGTKKAEPKTDERCWENACKLPNQITALRETKPKLLREDVERAIFSPANGVCETCMTCVCDLACKLCHFSHACLQYSQSMVEGKEAMAI